MNRSTFLIVSSLSFVTMRHVALSSLTHALMFTDISKVVGMGVPSLISFLYAIARVSCSHVNRRVNR